MSHHETVCCGLIWSCSQPLLATHAHGVAVACGSAALMQMGGGKLPQAALALQLCADSRAWAYVRQADPHRSKLNLVSLA